MGTAERGNDEFEPIFLDLDYGSFDFENEPPVKANKSTKEIMQEIMRQEKIQ